jgi:WD40 repeat protein
VATGRRIATLANVGLNSSVSSVAFSPNGKVLATADLDGVTSLWGITASAPHS